MTRTPEREEGSGGTLPRRHKSRTEGLTTLGAGTPRRETRWDPGSPRLPRWKREKTEVSNNGVLKVVVFSAQISSFSSFKNDLLR